MTMTAEQQSSQQKHLVSNPPEVQQAEEEENKDDVSPQSCATASAATDGEAKKEGDDHHHQTLCGWTDDKFEEWLKSELMKDPLHTQYPEIFDIAPSCITKWRKRYRGDKPTWHRIFDKDRVIKEFVEAVPIIDAVQRLVLSSENNKNKTKYTIIDLACGKGYLSMLLSELLPPSRVEKFILIDKNWPEHGKPSQSHHISCTHIAGHYFDTWPIQLWISKQDLKKSNQRHNIEERYLSSGPVIMMAVHLCGILSLKAVDFFNNNPNICFFCLKPCCLPGMVHAKRKEIFTLGEHCFEAKEVCMAGKWKKNRWHGPPRTELRQYFNRWANNLYLGISSEDSKKLQKTVMVQTDGGYQNEFLFAERNPNTNDVWGALLKDVDTTTAAVPVAVAADSGNDDDGAKREKRGEWQHQ